MAFKMFKHKKLKFRFINVSNLLMVIYFYKLFYTFTLFAFVLLQVTTTNKQQSAYATNVAQAKTGTDKPVVTSTNSTLLYTYSSTAMYRNWTSDCPCRLCGTSSVTGLRQIICDTGPMHHLPIYKIPPHIEFIEIRGTKERQNNLTLGPLFYRFPELKVLRVLHSNVPAIGQATFQYRTSLTELDLSYNVIENLIDASFKGLRKLEALNLSSNFLTDLTSAPFQHLISLRHLNLSHNRIRTITTRLFYNLTILESLDLSDNPISEITPQNTIDLRPLRRLHMSNCRLSELHSLFYRNVPNLELLDLRNNHIESLHKQEYRYLPNLTELYLDGNQLVVLPSMLLFGNHLARLGLSANALVQMHSETFLNATVTELNLSNNNFTAFDGNTFTPLALCLKVLDLSNIRSLKEPSTAVAKLIAPLSVLEKVSLSNLSLDSALLPVNLFSNHRKYLKSVNFSHNSFNQLDAKLIEEMNSLEVIDVSHNSLFELDADFLFTLSNLVNLTFAYFDHNPWSCFRCHLLVFRNLVSSTGDRPLTAYQNACQQQNRCAECTFPPQLEGYQLHTLEEWQLEWCTDPTVQLRVSTTEPNVGLVLALLIIIILMIVIICVIIYYRNRGAIYFTNEELLYSGRSPSTAGGGGGGVGHWAVQSPPGSNETEADKSTSSTVFNVSSRIRQFVNATASPPDSGGHSIRSSSLESLNRGPAPLTSANRVNGYANGHEPILKNVTHRDSTNTNVSNGYSKPTATILRRPKKQSSSVSTTSSKEHGARGVSYEEDLMMDTGSNSGSHYERPPSSKYRILKPKNSSSRSDNEGEEARAGGKEKKKSSIKRPVPPPLPPMAPRGAKPTTAPTKKVFLATNTTASSKRSPSNATISYTDSSSEEEEDSTKSTESVASGKATLTQSDSDSETHEHQRESSRPSSLPSTLQPHDDHSAEAENIEGDEGDDNGGGGDDDDDDDDDERDNISGRTSSPPTAQQVVRRLPLEGQLSGDEESSPDSSTQALAEGGSTSPSSTRSSDFTTKSPVNE